MNIELTMKSIPASVAAERERNDRFRACPGAICLSAGILALGADSQARIIDAVRGFAGFDDDPWDPHDIGDLEVTLSEPGIQCWRELIFFRVVTLPGCRAPSDLPSTPEAPADELMLTIMLASEW